MKFKLVTPERMVMNCQVEYVNAPGVEGAFGVMEGHAPFVSTLQDGGILEVTQPGGEKKSFTVTGGFAEVNPKSIIVLAEGLAENIA